MTGTWPFTHNWTNSFVVTHSFKTEILSSRSGFEQRRAIRYDPRRSIQTSVREAGDAARAVDDWLWSQGSDLFSFTDPTDGSTSMVRLPDQVQLDRPSERVVGSTITFAVQPGGATPPADVPITPPEAIAYRQRYVLPFYVNWRDGVPETIGIPRQSVDFDAGQIVVTRPVAFNNRTSGYAYLRDNKRITAIVNFFRWARGRQRDFWVPSQIGMPETVSGTTVTVPGRVPFDSVNMALRFELTDGFVYYRTVIAAGVVGNATLLALDRELPDDNPVRKMTWLRLGRFASDDMSVEWVTPTVAQMQVQFVTLPYAAPETNLFDDPNASDAVDYFGSFYGYDPLQVPVNQILPLASEWPTP